MPVFRKVGDSFEFSSSVGAGAGPGSVEIDGSITAYDDTLEKRVAEGFAIWLNVAAEDALNLYKGIVQTWVNKPTFARTSASETGDEISLVVGLAPGSIRKDTGGDRLLPGEIFNILDRGSDPHPISAREARRVSRLVKTAKGTIIMTSQAKPMLHFRVPFTAKTTPGQMSSGAGSRGDAWRITEHTEHPGTEPRGYSLAVAELVQDAMEATASTLIASMVLNRISAKQAASRIKGAIRKGISKR